MKAMNDFIGKKAYKAYIIQVKYNWVFLAQKYTKKQW